MANTRTVTVEVTWTSTHEVEINADEPPMASDDITTILSYEDVNSGGAEMTDWTVTDRG